MRQGLHDSFERPNQIKPGSNRNFGLVMAAAFVVLAGARYWHGSSIWPAWATIAIAFAATAWLMPDLLAPLNRLWFRFGLLLHKIVSPVMMAVIFFAVVMPVGLLMRLSGRRPLTPGVDAAAPSYWVARAQATAPLGSMSRQY